MNNADDDFKALIEMGVIQPVATGKAAVAQPQTAQKALGADPYVQGGSGMAFLQGAKRVALDKPAAMLEQGFNALRGDNSAYQAVQDRERNYDQQIAAIREQNPKSMLAGNVAGGVGLSAPLGLAIGAGFPMLAAGSGVLGSMGNAALTGMATEGMQYNPDESLQDKAKAMAISGGLGAGITGALGAGGKMLFGANKSKITPEQQDIAARAQALGIQMTPGELSGSSLMRTIEKGGAMSPLSSRVYDGIAKNNEAAMGKAMGGAIGQNVDRVSAKVLGDAKEALGATYKDITARNEVVLGRSVNQGLKAVEKEASESLGGVSPDVANYIKKIREATSPDSAYAGVIPGKIYEKWRSELGAKARNFRNSDPAEAVQYKSVQKILDDAFEKSVSEADLVLKKATDIKYANMKALDSVARNGGLKTDGTLSGRALANNLAGDPMRRNGKITDDLQTIADYSKSFPPLPDSGTARNSMFGLGIGSAGTLAGATMGAMPALAGGAGLLGANWAAHGLMQSNLGRKLLLEGLAPNLNTNLIGYGGGLLGSSSLLGR